MQSQKLDQSGKASETVQLKRSRAKGTNTEEKEGEWTFHFKKYK